MDHEWVKVEIVTREGTSGCTYLVKRVDGCGVPFEAKPQELTSFGSHDPESEQQIWKREELERVEWLLKDNGCELRTIKEDGNYLYRAVACQIYGDQEQYQKVRNETVEHIITYKKRFVASKIIRDLA